MNLTIDIGNTRVKTAVFQGHKMLFNDSYPLQNFKKSIVKIVDNYVIKYAIISSVGNSNEADFEFLSDLVEIHFLSYNTKVQFINKYKTPSSLGVDRIALVSASVDQFPNTNVLVFDVGSCITYDFVNDRKEYFGGAISPGIEMRYNALNTFTANLPKLSTVNEIPALGDTTDNAIHLGVLQGVICEIEGVIELFKAKNQKLTIVLTGGDTIFLAKNIKSTIFANPNFLLEGLNSILTYNIEV
jgi:type III pantothenate kinase